MLQFVPQRTYYFHSVQTNWRYIDSGRPEPKLIYSTSPGEDLPTDASPRTRSVLRGPSPRRGNASGFRRTFEAQGLGAHVARRTRTAAPRPRSTPLKIKRSFVSRRHKSRGDSRSRTGLQCGQAIVKKGAQRPGIQVYICGDPRSRTGLQCGQAIVREVSQRPGIQVYICMYV